MSEALERAWEALFAHERNSPPGKYDYRGGARAVLLAFLDTEGMVEKLAAIEHARWARWQAYVHSKCSVDEAGNLIIPKALAERWWRQILAPYSDLSEPEKESDRKEARVSIAALRAEAGES